MFFFKKCLLQTTLLTFLHLILIVRFPNMFHAAIPKSLLMPYLPLEQLQKFAQFSPFSWIGDIIQNQEVYGIRDHDYFLLGDTTLVPSDFYTSKDFLILFPTNTLTLSFKAVLPILFTPYWNFLLFPC